MDKILFQNKFLAIIERDDYFFLRQVRSNGVIVALLPFRVKDDTLEFLARLEICPAHGPDLDYYSITGGLESNKTIEETAKRELQEEAGYWVKISDMIGLGQVHPSKSADTTAYLFAADVTGKPQFFPQGDGTRFEANASVEWVDYEHGIQIKDPSFVTAMTRLMERRNEVYRHKS